jgi:hypothetical protein
MFAKAKIYIVAFLTFANSQRTKWQRGCPHVSSKVCKWEINLGDVSEGRTHAGVTRGGVRGLLLQACVGTTV